MIGYVIECIVGRKGREKCSLPDTFPLADAIVQHHESASAAKTIAYIVTSRVGRIDKRQHAVLLFDEHKIGPRDVGLDAIE